MGDGGAGNHCVTLRVIWGAFRSLAAASERDPLQRREQGPVAGKQFVYETLLAVIVAFKPALCGEPCGSLLLGPR